MLGLTQTLLVIHVLSGFEALAAGSFSMLSQKGGKLHRLSGKCFFAGMSGVFASAVFLSILKPNPFLFMVAFFSYYLTCSGYRALHRNRAPALPDWLISIAGTVFGIGLLVYSCFALFLDGMFALVPFSFGAVCLYSAVMDLKSFNLGESDSQARWANHGIKMGGAFAAAVTAFIVVNFSLGSFNWVLWILPGLFIGGWVSLMVKRRGSVISSKSEFKNR